MTVCNMTIEGGGRAGMIAPDETTFEWVRGRPAAPEDFDAAAERWRQLPTDPGASFDTEVEIDAAGIAPQDHLGHQPRHGRRGHRLGARPGHDGVAGGSRIGRAGARLHGAGAGTPMTEVMPERVFIGSCTNARVEDLRAGGRRWSTAARSPPAYGRWSCPAPSRSRPPAEAEGLRRRLPRGRLRVARRRLLDVPRHEPRHPAARASAAPRPRTATSRDARARAAAPTWSARRWRRRPRSTGHLVDVDIRRPGAEDEADRRDRGRGVGP